MADKQAVLSRKKGEKKRRRAYPTVAESAVVGIAAADAAAMPEGWTPSRFFGAWKKEVGKTAGMNLVWGNMEHYAGFTPDSLVEAVDLILRTTVIRTYKPDDIHGVILASDNDSGAMRAHATALVDASWRDFWTVYHEKCTEPGMAAGAVARPGSAGR